MHHILWSMAVPTQSISQYHHACSRCFSFACGCCAVAEASVAKRAALTHLHSHYFRNWTAVAVASIAKFFVGAIWFSPLLFVDAWLNHLCKEKASSLASLLLFASGTDALPCRA